MFDFDVCNKTVHIIHRRHTCINHILIDSQHSM